MTTPIERIVEAFQALTPESVERLHGIYAEDAHFKDPFNDVQSLTEIQRIFRHMFLNLENPRFIITQSITQDMHCFLTWEFRFALKRNQPQRELCILGASHLVLGADGRIAMHRDYWDAAEELYEKLPLIGSLMRWLKRRVNA